MIRSTHDVIVTMVRLDVCLLNESYYGTSESCTTNILYSLEMNKNNNSIFDNKWMISVVMFSSQEHTPLTSFETLIHCPSTIYFNVILTVQSMNSICY